MKSKHFKSAGILAVLLIFGLVLAGCASMFGSVKPLGTLTVTGIPAEYEGKSASFAEGDGSLFSSLSQGLEVTGVIANGEISLSFSGRAKKNFDIKLRIWDTTTPAVGDVPAAVFGFSEVVFAEGAAKAEYENAIKLGIVTLTGIPATYEDKQIEILIGYLPPNAVSSLIGGAHRVDPNSDYASAYGHIKNGATTVEVFGSIPPKGFGVVKKGPFIISGAKDIMAEITVGSNEVATGVSKPVLDLFLFKAVEITDNKASISFRNGEKIK